MTIALTGSQMFLGPISRPLTLAQICQDWRIAPGSTIYLRGGTYRGDFDIAISGESGSPITFAPYPGENVVIDGKMIVTGDYVTINGARRWRNTYSAWQSRISAEETSHPTDIPDNNFIVEGVGCKVINCDFDNILSVEAFAGAVGVDFYGNLIRFVGWIGPDRGHGHCFYFQNNSLPAFSAKHNIGLDNFGWGLHAYWSGSKQRYYDVQQNVFFRNGSLALPTFDLTPGLLFGGGGESDNVYLHTNLAWGNNSSLWWDGSGTHTNATLINNMLPDGITAEGPVEYLENSGNVTSAPESGSAAYLWANEHLEDHAFLTVYNWGSADTVAVDVSSLYENGDVLRLSNTQDVYQDRALYTVSGGTITVDMRASQHSVETPAAWSAPETTFPAFGCFLIALQ